MKTYTVATFYHPKPGRPPTRSKISAYTRWYSPEWTGCELSNNPGFYSEREPVRPISGA